MEEVSTIGLDLAKSVFQVHGIDAAGRVVVRRQLRRGEVLGFFARLRPCLVGMEACATAHHWGRELTRLGHTVKLMPPAYVKPYVKRGKTAEAIAEAVTRPTMRFVAVKSMDQQAVLMLHKVRDLLPAAHHADQRLAGPLGRVRGRDRPRPGWGQGRHREAARDAEQPTAFGADGLARAARSSRGGRPRDPHRWRGRSWRGVAMTMRADA